MEAAFAAVRERGNIADVWAVVSRSRWAAISAFFPKVGDAMRQAALERRAQLRAERASVVKPAKPSIVRLANLDLLDRINAVVPRNLPRDQRDDIIGAMAAAVLEGNLRPDALVAGVRRFVSASFKSDHNRWGAVSLDTPAYRDSETPLIETISRGLWD
jgi:hypothetical protein